MKTIVSSLLVLGCLGLAGATPLCATDPAKSLSKGKVLILKNEHTMEGDIERVGDRYRVRRLIGETWVPAERALCLVASLPDAYAYLRARANLQDPDERLRLAHWCQLNGLREQALTEIQAAVELRPDHAETRRLLQHLRQSALTATAAKPTPATSAAKKPLAEATPPVELTTDALGLFATRVQPILMNTCAACHATGRGGAFQLTQAYDAGLANRRTLERNLAAVLAQVNLNQPESSRLLSKAVSDHARTGRAPIKDRRDAPYRTLESWVKLTVSNNPHLRDALPAAASTPTPAQPTNACRNLPEASQTQWGAGAASSAPHPLAVTVPMGPTPLPVSRAMTAPPPPPPRVGPADPYDPEPFNRQLHPEPNKPGPGK